MKKKAGVAAEFRKCKAPWLKHGCANKGAKARDAYDPLVSCNHDDVW